MMDFPTDILGRPVHCVTGHDCKAYRREGCHWAVYANGEDMHSFTIHETIELTPQLLSAFHIAYQTGHHKGYGSGWACKAAEIRKALDL